MRVKCEICIVKKSTKKVVKKTLTKEDSLKKLGERIKQLRIKSGYTSYEYFAYENDISRAQFGRYERGEDIRFGSLVKIINAFGMSIDEFFSEGFD
jgi:hypothetical protein